VPADATRRAAGRVARAAFVGCRLPVRQDGPADRFSNFGWNGKGKDKGNGRNPADCVTTAK
jgi:hypothetical protein